MSLIPLRFLRTVMASPFQAIGRCSRSRWDPFLTAAEWRLITEMPEIMMKDFDLAMKPTVDSKEVIKMDKDGFKLTINLEDFKPSEITVKTINNIVVIEGKQQMQEDDHFMSREFVRKYTIPDGYDPFKITSTFTSNGILNIKAPPPEQKIEEPEEHIIEVKHIAKNE